MRCLAIGYFAEDAQGATKMTTIVFAILVLIGFGLAIWAEGFLADVLPLPIVRAIQALTGLLAAVVILQRAGVV